MKQRVHIATSQDYATAKRIQQEKQEAFPDSEFQVRKTRKGFKVVERINLDGDV